jgi:hypothetical protein
MALRLGLSIVSEEHKLKMYENRVLRRIFGSERQELTGGRGKLFNEELDDLYFSPLKVV